MWHMVTMKRRVIYMSDTEWSAITEVARNHGQTTSALIREKVGLLPRDGWHETPGEKAAHDFGESAAELENSLNEVGHAFQRRDFRPAPKPSQKGK